MADRYWVGGTGTWDATNTVNWSATSGGAGGASVPTATDNVFINGSSGVGTVTTGTGATCANFDCTGYTGTFNSVTNALAVNGDFILATGMALAGSSQFTLLAATGTSFTLNTAGKTLGTTVIGSILAGYQGTRTLASALTCGVIAFYSGTFDTAGFSVSASNMSSSVSTQSRTLTLGASTITFSGAGLDFGNPTNTYLTLNAGTSTISFTGSGTYSFSGAGKTFYNVQFTNTGVSARSINGANTFNNLYLAPRGSAGWNYYILTADQTVNGTLTLGATGISYFRTQLRSSAPYTLFTTARTITVAAFAAGSTDWDFCGIAITGAAAPISGTRFGDAGGSINSGITFATPKTVYKNATGTTAITANAWSNTSGGAGNNIYFPLPQDTAIFDNNSNATFTTSANQLAGTLDFSARTTGITFNVTASIEIYKDLILDNNMAVLTTTTRFFFFGSNNQSFNGGGIGITCGVTVGKSAGTLTLASAITQAATATQSFTVQSGTVNFGSYAHSFVQLSSTDTAYSPTLTFGGGSVTIPSTNTSPFLISNGNATISGTGSVYLTNTGTGVKNITATPTGGRYLDFYVTGGSGNASFSGTVGKIDFYNGGASTYTGNFANTAVSVYGNLILKSGMGWAAQPNTVTLKGGSGTNTINFAGVAAGCPITFNNTEGGGWVLASAYSTSNATNLLNGSLNLAGFNATSGAWAFQNSPSLEFNGATITLTGAGTVWNAATGTPTITNSSGTAVVSLTSGSTKTFAGGSQTFPITLNQGGAGILIVSGSNKFNNITNTASGSLLFTAGTTNEFLVGFNYTSAGPGRIGLSSTTTSQATLKKPTTWYMGANSLDNGNNTGLIFTAGGGIDYLAVSYINGITGGSTYSSDIAETATGSDSIEAAQTFEVSLTDTATGTDSIAAAVTTAYNASVSETATGSDSVSATVTFASVIVETATGTDSISASFSFSSSITESATGTDSIAAGAAYSRAIAETATGTELIYSVGSFGSAVAETSTGTDSISASLAYSRSITETATGTDSVAAAATFVVSLSESATGTDAVTPDLQITRSVSESATGSDAVSASSAVTVSISETGSGADTVVAELLIDRAIIESASGTDSISALMDAYSLVSESATITDAASALTDVLADVAESASGVDDVSVTLTLPSDITESAAGADEVAVTLTLPGTIDETATGADTVSVVLDAVGLVSEQASGADSATTAMTAVATVSEAVSGADAITVALTLPASVTESGAVSDAPAAVLFLYPAVVESAAGTDSVSVSVASYPSISETASVTDAVLSGILYLSAVAEAASGTDTAAAVLLLSASVSESSTGTDAVATALLFNVVIAETATGSDAIVAGNVIYVALSETATISDLLAAGYLWNIIDDSQTPAWGAVQNDQTPAWAAINSDVSATWSSTSTTQSAGWGVVDDSQDPEWQNTNTL